MDVTNHAGAGAPCRGCGHPTFRLDTASTCANEACERFGVAVDHAARTAEEARAHAIAPLGTEDAARLGIDDEGKAIAEALAQSYGLMAGAR